MGVNGLWTLVERGLQTEGATPVPAHFDHVYIDAASILHRVVQSRGLAEMEELCSKKKVMRAACCVIKDRLTCLLLACNPRVSVTIAFDGPAAVAKALHQYKRRCKDVDRLVAAGKQVPRISSLAATPGTRVIKQLSEALEEVTTEWVQGDKGRYAVFSNPDVQGEGEHKLMAVLLERLSACPDDKHMVLSSDSDSLLLAMQAPRSWNVFVVAFPSRRPTRRSIRAGAMNAVDISRVLARRPMQQALAAACGKDLVLELSEAADRALSRDVAFLIMIYHGNDYLTGAGPPVPFTATYFRLRGTPRFAKRALLVVDAERHLVAFDAEFLAAVLGGAGAGGRSSARRDDVARSLWQLCESRPAALQPLPILQDAVDLRVQAVLHAIGAARGGRRRTPNLKALQAALGGLTEDWQPLPHSFLAAWRWCAEVYAFATAFSFRVFLPTPFHTSWSSAENVTKLQQVAGVLESAVERLRVHEAAAAAADGPPQASNPPPSVLLYVPAYGHEPGLASQCIVYTHAEHEGVWEKRNEAGPLPGSWEPMPSPSLTSDACLLRMLERQQEALDQILHGRRPQRGKAAAAAAGGRGPADAPPVGGTAIRYPIRYQHAPPGAPSRVPSGGGCTRSASVAAIAAASPAGPAAATSAAEQPSPSRLRLAGRLALFEAERRLPAHDAYGGRTLSAAVPSVMGTLLLPRAAHGLLHPVHKHMRGARLPTRWRQLLYALRPRLSKKCLLTKFLQPDCALCKALLAQECQLRGELEAAKACLLAAHTVVNVSRQLSARLPFGPTGAEEPRSAGRSASGLEGLEARLASVLDATAPTPPRGSVGLWQGPLVPLRPPTTLAFVRVPTAGAGGDAPTGAWRAPSATAAQLCSGAVVAYVVALAVAGAWWLGSVAALPRTRSVDGRALAELAAMGSRVQLTFPATAMVLEKVDGGASGPSMKEKKKEGKGSGGFVDAMREYASAYNAVCDAVVDPLAKQVAEQRADVAKRVRNCNDVNLLHRQLTHEPLMRMALPLLEEADAEHQRHVEAWRAPPTGAIIRRGSRFYGGAAHRPPGGDNHAGPAGAGTEPLPLSTVYWTAASGEAPPFPVMQSAREAYGGGHGRAIVALGAREVCGPHPRRPYGADGGLMGDGLMRGALVDVQARWHCACAPTPLPPQVGEHAGSGRSSGGGGRERMQAACQTWAQGPLGQRGASARQTAPGAMRARAAACAARLRRQTRPSSSPLVIF